MSGPPDRAAYEAALDELWPAVRRAFNYPLLTRVRLAGGPGSEAGAGGDGEALPATPGGADRRMGYRWDDHEVVVSGDHLERLAPADGADLRDLLRPLLAHELGHYACFPRELSHHLRYLDRARRAFGPERGPGYYALYADVGNELRLLESRLAGEDLLELRRRTLEALDGDASLAGPRRTAHRRVQRLLLGLYARTFPDLPAVVEPTAAESGHLDRLAELPYLDDDPGTHERNLVLFGRVLDDVLADLPVGPADLDPPEDRGKPRGSLPFAGDAVERIPAARLDEALSAALEEAGLAAYERLADLLESEAGYVDPLAGEAAGLDRADLERNDELVAFYRRWARGHPVFVADRRLPVEAGGRYRRGRRPFEPGDPLHRVNPFASLGALGVPGVSQVDRYVEGAETVERPGVPDLLVGLDSSGSMPDPAEESHAVLAAVLLAETYHRNGAAVGGYNFSADVAFLPPGRDLDPLLALLCARWGGGTVLDWATLTRFVRGMDDLDGLALSDEADHEAALDRLAGGDDRAPAGGDGPAADPAFAGLDHVLVTDGDLANPDEAAAFLEAVADHARNLLFLTDPARYDEWADRELPNTWVYAAEGPSDLVGLAVGQGRRLATGAGSAGDDEAAAPGRPGG